MRRRFRDRYPKYFRESVTYPYSQSLPFYFKKRKDLPKTYVHLFIERVGSAFLFPSSDRKLIRLEAENLEDEQQIIDALDDGADSIADALWRFVDQGVLFDLIENNKCFCEIVYTDDNLFSFVPIWNYAMFEIMGNIFQYVPKSIRKEKNLPIIIRLKRKNIFSISIPRKYRRTLRKLMSGLDKVSDEVVMPKFAREDLMEGRKGISYDFRLYRKSVKIFVGRLTKSIGWSAGEFFQDEELEYYNLVRFLRFEQFKYDLRQSIILGINQALFKVNRTWKVRPKIIHEIFPKQEDIDTSIIKLREGNGGFKDLINPYFKFS